MHSKQKQDMKTLVAILAIFIGTGFLAACGSTSSDNGGAGSPSNPGTTCTNCPTSSSPQTGFYAQTSNFVTPGYMNNGSSFTVSSGMTNVLQNMMGVCNRANQTGGFSGGYAGCGVWQGGAHDMVVYSENGSTSNAVKLIIRSVPGSMGSYSWYSYSVPSFKNLLLSVFGFSGSYNPSGIFDPMVLDATIWPINGDANGNSQGFEVRANGPTGSYGWNKILQLIVPNGKMEDASWNFKLFYTDVAHLVSVNNNVYSIPAGAQTAATGLSVRCQSQHCGMDTTYFGY